VQNWSGIGEKMYGFLEEGFHAAVMRDMMTLDEEGMFYLLCYEQSVCGFDDVMDVILKEEVFGAVLAQLDAFLGQLR
jgi:hypothetical protein